MDYVALLTYIVVITTTPGPNTIMVTASGTNFGFKRTIPHIWGISIGTPIVTALTCLGLGAVFTAYPILHTALSWAGLAYMLFLAWKLLGIKIGTEKKIPQPISFVQAVLFQFINPKVWVASVTIASVFLPKTGEILLPTAIIFAAIFISCGFSSCIWTLFGKSMKRFLKTDKNQMVFNIIMAALLVSTAILIILE